MWGQKGGEGPLKIQIPIVMSSNDKGIKNEVYVAVYWFLMSCK